MNELGDGRRARTILLVDDEEAITTLLREAFRQGVPGARILVAHDGLEALRVLSESPVDLIVTDHRMPGMDGAELLANAARTHPGVPRILLTGFADVPLASRAINEAHVTMFVEKPAPVATLVRAANDALDAREQRVMREKALARAFQSIGRIPPTPAAGKREGSP